MGQLKKYGELGRKQKNSFYSSNNIVPTLFFKIQTRSFDVQGA
jgi:hypothetical protein